MLVENFVTETFLWSQVHFLLSVHCASVRGPGTDSVQEDDNFRCIKALWSVQLLHLNSFTGRQNYV